MPAAVLEKAAIFKSSFSLGALLDHFIPRELQVRPEAHRRARMFMMSHAFGPVLGNSIPLYLRFVLHIQLDYRFWIFLSSIMAFWIYPFLLKSTKRYHTIAFISIQNLIFCIFWACYSYGGINSPFLSWALIIPLLAFFYLPATGMLRNLLLVQIFASVGVFGFLVATDFEFPRVDLEQYQLIGLISTVSLCLYVVMMAMYFANVFREQNLFEQELGALVADADHLQSLTTAAQQATLAKANFVASMSHELRTPLNAVIGYSQLLLDDVDAVQDKEFARDVTRIQDAGNRLLSLINDILDFSKIEAGKMNSEITCESLKELLNCALSEINKNAPDCKVTCRTESEADVYIDRHGLMRAVQHLVYGVQAPGKTVTIKATVEDGEIAIDVQDPLTRPVPKSTDTLFDVFSDQSDDSTTKYGGVGTALALSQKFAQFIGGNIAVEFNSRGQRLFRLRVPAHSRPTAMSEAA